ncbi:hypothetical protein PTKIN_Ptkin01aG0128900 [Pterospermum kingtungense]
MAEVEKLEEVVVNGNKSYDEENEEEERLLEKMAVLDFDMLCSTVALQTQGKWRKLENADDSFEQGNGDFGAVLRMWEGEVVLDFLDDRRLALQSACCPCCRFGKNMRRAGFGYCFLQGTVYFVLVVSVFLNFLAFIVTKQNCFLYLAVAFLISLGAYLGFFRAKIKRKFNVRESRTLEMNNVQDGTWHGCGDICIGSYGEGSKAFLELHPPISIKTPEPCKMQNSLNCYDNA